ncbi:hypothetical protein V6N13_106943 [Hibiscus sabdariffa]
MEFTSKNLLVPCLFFFFIGYLAVPVTCDTLVTLYSPMENITIDCGSSIEGQSPDGRSWVGDVNGKFTPLEQQNNTNRSSMPSTAAIQNSVDDRAKEKSQRFGFQRRSFTVEPLFLHNQIHQVNQVPRLISSLRSLPLLFTG